MSVALARAKGVALRRWTVARSPASWAVSGEDGVADPHGTAQAELGVVNTASTAIICNRAGADDRVEDASHQAADLSSRR